MCATISYHYVYTYTSLTITHTIHHNPTIPQALSYNPNYILYRCILLARKKGVSKYHKFTFDEDIQLLKGFHVYGGDDVNLWSNVSMCFLSHRTARECKYR